MTLVLWPDVIRNSRSGILVFREELICHCCSCASSDQPFISNRVCTIFSLPCRKYMQKSTIFWIIQEI